MVRRALDKGRVLLAFQPVVLARDSGRVAFYEGLIRVLDENGRVIPARDFIATTETSETRPDDRLRGAGDGARRRSPPSRRCGWR